MPILQRIALAMLVLVMMLGCSKKQPDLTPEERAGLRAIGEIRDEWKRATPQQLKDRDELTRLMQDELKKAEGEERQKSFEKAEQDRRELQQEGAGKFN